jgi:hypothetical protein
LIVLKILNTCAFKHSLVHTCVHVCDVSHTLTIDLISCLVLQISHRSSYEITCNYFDTMKKIYIDSVKSPAITGDNYTCFKSVCAVKSFKTCLSIWCFFRISYQSFLLWQLCRKFCVNLNLIDVFTKLIKNKSLIYTFISAIRMSLSIIYILIITNIPRLNIVFLILCISGNKPNTLCTFCSSILFQIKYLFSSGRRLLSII